MLNKESAQIIDSIIRVLERNKEGLDISQISKLINVYRATVSKYLLVLQNKEVVSSKKLGPAKVYFLAENNVHQSDFSKNKSRDWIDEFIDEVKEEMKREILGN